jgi:hypothetical protein
MHVSNGHADVVGSEESLDDETERERALVDALDKIVSRQPDRAVGHAVNQHPADRYSYK